VAQDRFADEQGVPLPGHTVGNDKPLDDNVHACGLSVFDVNAEQTGFVLTIPENLHVSDIQIAVGPKRTVHGANLSGLLMFVPVAKQVPVSQIVVFIDPHHFLGRGRADALVLQQSTVVEVRCGKDDVAIRRESRSVRRIDAVRQAHQQARRTGSLIGETVADSTRQRCHEGQPGTQKESSCF